MITLTATAVKQIRQSAKEGNLEGGMKNELSTREKGLDDFDAQQKLK